ncbi:HK97 family phage prohead protease [Dysgonomonas sp. ZJ279]|uniref:HK97 family phage prohead protease n=1 Tax=Dysgonomonas sp. ZJ279 TaxID=2709796 RepID=UPI0013E99FE7|nr:HK97 family phage prohead protease [Dysgonomonas sp. ZJ279]
MRMTLSDNRFINDRGFKIDFAGLDLTRFNLNPIMLHNHNYDEAIGMWKELAIEDDKLRGTPDFDTDDELGAKIAGKVERGYIKGCSLGLRVIELQHIDGEFIATKSELIEVSIVAIPSDAGAVRLFNDRREILTLDQVKLSFNNPNNNNQEMALETIKLSASTVESLNLKAGYTERDIEIAVKEKDEKITQLTNEKIDAYLLSAVTAGKITEKQRIAYVELAKKDFDTVKSVIEAIETENKPTLADMATKTKLSAERADWTYLDWMKKDSKGLQNLKHENPTEFERLKSKTIKE